MTQKQVEKLVVGAIVSATASWIVRRLLSKYA